MESLFIIIPAYNEKDNIENVVNQWYPVIEAHNADMTSRLVIINDGSKDNTYELLIELAKNRPLLIPLTKKNGGHGSTLLFGYRYAIKSGGWIFQTDSDGQTNPDEFEKFWELRNQYDAILGDRQSRRQDGASRVFVENTLRFILKIMFGVNVPDANAPFRLMRRELVEKYIKKMPDDFNLPNVMLTTYFSYFKENIRFERISFKPRQGGTNSINIKKIVKIGWKAVGDFRNLKKHIED